MKNLIISLLGCAVAFSPLAAEEAQKQDGERKSPGGRPDGSFFKAMDKDGDGVISKEEAGERWERLGKLDKDGDGKLTMQELMAFRPEAGEGRPGATRPDGPRPGGGEMFARADKNGDGKLTEDEVPAEMWARISRLDKDGDGAVSKEEMAAMMGGRTPAGPGAEGMRRPGGAPGGLEGGPGSLFSRYDTDKDGKLSKSEVPEEIWARLSKADEDADGLISKEELEKVYKARDGGPRPKRRPDGDRPKGERKPAS